MPVAEATPTGAPPFAGGAVGAWEPPSSPPARNESACQERMPAAMETPRAVAVAPCGAALPRAAACSLATLRALNVVTPAAWAEAAPRTASAAGAPELSAHEVDEHVSVLDPLLTAAGSGLDALEEALAGVLAPATAEADEAPADVTLPELETAFESVPGGANARILLDLPCVRAAYAHTLPGGGWSPVRENFGARRRERPDPARPSLRSGRLRPHPSRRRLVAGARELRVPGLCLRARGPGRRGLRAAGALRRPGGRQPVGERPGKPHRCRLLR